MTTFNALDCGPGIFVSTTDFLTASDSGRTVGVAADFTANLVWFYSPVNARWNGSATANPATGVGGISISAFTGTKYVALGLNSVGDYLAANFGASPWVYSLPSGFSSWNTATGSTNTLDPATLGSGLALSGSNLSVSVSSGASWRSVRSTAGLTSGKAYFEILLVGRNTGSNPIVGLGNTSLGTADFPGDVSSTSIGWQASGVLQGGSGTVDVFNGPTGWRTVRATSGFSSGKYYFEQLINGITSGGLILGAASSSASLNNYLGSDAYGVGYQPSAGTITRGGSTVLTADTCAVGNKVGIALDFDNKKVWFWNPTTSKWNGGLIGAQNPVGNVGGVDITTLLASGYVLPAASFDFDGLRDSTTANFGATAFGISSVPTGFTSGFPDPTAGTTPLRLTQAGAEAWGTNTNPPLRVTQIGAEAWGSNTAAPLRVTQIGAEAWGSNTAAPVRLTQAGAEAWIDLASPYVAPAVAARPIVFIMA